MYVFFKFVIFLFSIPLVIKFFFYQIITLEIYYLIIFLINGQNTALPTVFDLDDNNLLKKMINAIE